MCPDLFNKDEFYFRNILLKKKIVCLFLLFFGILSCFDVKYPKDVLLNHIGTVLILGLLAYDIYTRFLSLTAFYSLSVFCFFHIMGAHWLYSYVPYNNLFVYLFDWDLQAYFGFTRNHYDRFVHFISGILFFPYLMDHFIKKSGLKYTTAILVSFLAIQTVGMLYEILEWVVSIILSSDSVENYNGQQGDIWDAHKDMALALVSSSLMYFYYWIRKSKS